VPETVVPLASAVDQPVVAVPETAAPFLGAVEQPFGGAAETAVPFVGAVEPVAGVPETAAPFVGAVEQPFGGAADATMTPLGAIDPPAGMASESPSPALDLPDGAAVVGTAGHFPAHDVGSDGPSGIVAAIDAVNPFDGVSITQILGAGYTTWKLTFFAALLAAHARWYGNTTGTFSSVRLVAFTNAQVIRCGVVSPIVRMATAPLTAFSNAVASSGTGSVRITAPRSVAVLRRSLRVSLDGPSSVVRRGLGNDRAIMMQVGKLLLLAYGAFLAVWFWATRLRWNGR
jgi:hypothetical protein